MKPALFLVCDPVPDEAHAILTGILGALPSAADRALTATCGPIGAVAVLPAPLTEPNAGAHILETDTDILVWAGEMFLPESWFQAGMSERPERRTTRILLEKLCDDGIEVLGQLDGGFCGAWYNRTQRRWFIFNDRMGQVPIFWSTEGDRLVVSPSPSLTWRGIGTPLHVSSAGVADLIRTQNMTEDHTLIEGVHWLPRGTGLWWGEEGAGYARYWDFNYLQPQIEDENEAIDLYLDHMESTLRRHTRAHKELLLGISGGLDSRLFLALCERIGQVPHCFTSGWPFYEDVRFGRKLARAAGASYELLPLRPELLPERLEKAIIDTGGLQSAAHLPPLMPIRPYLQEHAGAVVLDGFFHGMVGGGTVPADEDVLPGRSPHESHWASKLLHSGGDRHFVNELLQPELASESEEQWRQGINETYRRAPVKDPLHRAEYTMVHARRGRVDVLGTSLLRTDVLVRNPASDLLMLEWHQRVSPRLRRSRAIYLAALRRYFPKYARVPRADGCSAMPVARDRLLREYCWQMKRLRRAHDWLRYPMTRRWGTSSRALRAWAFQTWALSGRLEILLEPSARILNWVRHEALLDLWKQAEGDALRAEPVLTLATLEIALRSLESESRLPVVTEPRIVRARHRATMLRIRAEGAPCGSAA